ncbi:hypothetical protein ACH4VR_23335 [Streptomyces sp. NPDC020883]|uniref:hypothetical protein n=1 Tax=Streptomyces sp. NPDC020883 TaxID=3365099 RepID=UPI0037A248D8
MVGVLLAGGGGLGTVEEKRGQGGKTGWGVPGFESPCLVAGAAQGAAGGGAGQDLHAGRFMIGHANGGLEQGA